MQFPQRLFEAICFKFSNPLANSLLVSVRGTLVGQSGNVEPVTRGDPARAQSLMLCSHRAAWAESFTGDDVRGDDTRLREVVFDPRS